VNMIMEYGNMADFFISSGECHNVLINMIMKISLHNHPNVDSVNDHREIM
jgi:hypothetical protein